MKLLSKKKKKAAFWTVGVRPASFDELSPGQSRFQFTERSKFVELISAFQGQGSPTLVA